MKRPQNNNAKLRQIAKFGTVFSMTCMIPTVLNKLVLKTFID